jgi:hypothetical protein
MTAAARMISSRPPRRIRELAAPVPRTYQGWFSTGWYRTIAAIDVTWVMKNNTPVAIASFLVGFMALDGCVVVLGTVVAVMSDSLSVSSFRG